jgi:hypothetical protein
MRVLRHNAAVQKLKSLYLGGRDIGRQCRKEQWLQDEPASLF